MAPLIILLVTFLILYLLDRAFLDRRLGISLMGRISMSAMLLATGISHFSSTDMFIEIMPDAVPFKREIVYFTGICELMAIPGLLWTKTARLTSIVLVVFFLAILPANIVGSLKQVPLGGMEYGTIYLVFRIPLQIFFILWVWFFGVRRSNYA
jgi:uncharacterized membrane protein